MKKIACILAAALILSCMVFPAAAADEMRTVSPKTISFEEYSKIATPEDVKNMEKMAEVFEKYNIEYVIYEPASPDSDKYEGFIEINDPAELERLINEYSASATRATDNYYREYTFRPNGSFHYNLSQPMPVVGGTIINRNANVPYSYAYYSNGTPYFSSLNTNSITSWISSPFFSYSQKAAHWTPNSNKTSGDVRILGVLTLGAVLNGYPVGFTFDSDWQYKMTLVK
ncbi:hypothetical protein MmiHf6_06930 [Methanimicrococcus hongohii]|uniref:Uncharacterized protein n=1 Tax=Methanimicrococcus hongohii TaxID=3028295 RepID=A0AA96V8F8_9EURY|nr:hypothetical protein [Methanimicrococcus sp. Hf6]WNY23386.1 hypothetical protein MmiHf6_06930 [Methanimicrococcus sp. Hf6]